MTNVLLYWNHICVLHNQEKAFLSRLAESLKAEDIALTVRYFGLGYPEHMSEYLAREDAVLPDLIVSADLEVFEDARLMEKLRPTLHQSRDFVPLADSAALSCCERGASADSGHSAGVFHPRTGACRAHAALRNGRPVHRRREQLRH